MTALLIILSIILYILLVGWACSRLFKNMKDSDLDDNESDY